MKIVIVTPTAGRSRTGNSHTAKRWARFLEELGHRVQVQVEWDGRKADAMLALHARKSHSSIRSFASAYPGLPLILALTGTDLYRDIRVNADARESMALATRMIVLQELGLEELTPELRAKTRVLYQSAPPAPRLRPPRSFFAVSVIGHLREEKDPFRCALALAHLPPGSRLRVTHLGRAMTPELEKEARAWMARESRYRWLGEVPRWQARRHLARSHVLVMSSRLEGGANAVCEALAAGVPVIASRIPGNVGMLGSDYEGYYSAEDEQALARLLHRAETDSDFYRHLKAQCAARQMLVKPEREQQGLGVILQEAVEETRRAS